MPPQPTASGIVTDEKSGQRQIPESVRADGTTRRAIKIRPGYRPPEDVEVYKNPTAENFRTRGKGPVPGAEGLQQDENNKPDQQSANKNAKRREARKKAAAKAAAEEPASTTGQQSKAAAAAEELDPEAEKEKKVRNLKKKLRQAKELKDKKEGGESLLPEQIAKVIKINELIRELDSLGFDADGELKNKTSETAEGQS